jgi:DeoR/GlpR family transcriptional regulator of sugar metabolism
MLASQRKELILDRLDRDGQVVAKVLSAELGLSEDTIRRDLRELAAEGRVQRVHGGALPVSPAIRDLSARAEINQDAKRMIGRAAAQLVAPGQLVFLDGGTTTLQLVRHLPSQLAATVITHSPSIAVALSGHSKIEVLLIGGRLYRHSMVSVGAATLEGISRLQPDIYFMGATGVHVKRGVTTGDFEEAAIKRAILERSAETVLLASSEKIGVLSPFKIAPIESLTGIVVEATAPRPFQDACRKASVTVAVADRVDR